MVVLIDTNVIIDYLTERADTYHEATEIVNLCQQKKVDGVLAFHSIPNIWYILRRKPDAERREMLKHICTIFTVVGASHDAVFDALSNTDFKDFEDCLQDKCAVGIHADYIVTRNVSDYTHSTTKAVTPAEFCESIKE